jgi:hypothetical protein
MDLQEINGLISLRRYVQDSLSNPTIDRQMISYLNGVLIMIDKKIITQLKSDEFKEYINYSDVKKSIEDVAKITNIKSGLKR